MNAVAYIWRGLINCFYLFVILYVFDNIKDKNTSIIIAVLALTRHNDCGRLQA